VDLLTLDVQSYGEECLAGSKVVEHVAAPAATAAVNAPVVPQHSTTAAASAVMGPPLRPQPPQPVPPGTSTNVPHSQPSEHVFLTVIVMAVVATAISLLYIQYM